MAPPAILFPVFKAVKIDLDLAVKGFEVQPAKSKCYINEEYRNDAWDQLREECPNGDKAFRLSVCDVSVGYEGYVKAYLNEKKDKIENGY